jgi:iron(III) transport system substrate-binding protein
VSTRNSPSRLANLIGALALLAAACAPAAQPSPPPAKPAEPAKPAAAEPAKPAAPPAAKPDAAAKTNPALEQLVAAAKAEGKLNLAGPSSLGDSAAQRLVAGMNARYGTNIQVTWTGAGQAGPVVAQIITERATGGKTSYDIFLINDGQMVKLFTEDQLQKFDYRSTFNLPEGATGFDSTVTGFANQLILPAYNTKLVPPADAPKSWDDVVDPKWKGKIGVSTSVHHLVRLSQVWGDEKATEYARKLGALDPKLGQLNESYDRLVLGETMMNFTQTNSQLERGKQKGDPVSWALDVRPAIGSWYYCGALKGASNPNTALLFCGYMMDNAAFDVWAQNQGRELIFDPTTELGNIYAKNKQDVVLLDDKFAVEELEKREKKYTPIIGFR